jgi:serine protease Do
MATQKTRQKQISKSLLVAAGLVFATTACTVNGAADNHGSEAALALTNKNSTADIFRSATPSTLPDFATLARKIGPAVVNVSATYVGEMTQAKDDSSDGDEPMSQPRQQFSGQRTLRERQNLVGVGSGFVVDGDGTIVTNSHLVDGAAKISVTLADGRSFDAEILGMDQKTDIAVVKINAPQSLPAVSLGDSDRLEVGEWVMAVGNPFGLDHTVTSGIVSAKGRHIGAGPYDDFIQTDAKINPGNSGGALVNIRGEVIGMNTAIFSESGGNIGIGFAIPANLVKEILPQLRSAGRVVRSYVGLQVQQITPELADALGLEQPGGVLVDEVAKGGPADHAGIKTGDIILAFDDKAIKNAADLPGQSARLAPGSSVPVKITRDGELMTLTVTVEALDETEIVATSANEALGLIVQALTSDLAEELELKSAEGVIIVFVRLDSAADQAGLRRGDVITEINRQPVRDLPGYNSALASRDQGEALLLRVMRGGGGLFLAMKR